MSKLQFNKFGWIVISWMEDGYRKERKFDYRPDAVQFLRELKKKGLK